MFVYMRSDRDALDRQLHGATKRIRDELLVDQEPERQARHRDQWPLMWEALDELIHVVDRLYPRHAEQDRNLFDTHLTPVPGD
jgi:hypothetical protein